MKGLPEVATLWIGGNLSWVEQLFLNSFGNAGHGTAGVRRAMLLVTGSAAKAPAQSEALLAAHQAAASHYQQGRIAEPIDA